MDPHAAHLAAVTAYVAAFEAGDARAAADLFAEAATLEDPVGGQALQGRAAITAFYESAMSMKARLELTGPVRLAGDAAAFPFTVHVAAGPGTMQVDVIDIFRFDADGKIITMQAFWGPANVRAG